MDAIAPSTIALSPATESIAAPRPIPFDAGRLDTLMEDAGIDALVVTSKHNIQYLLGGYRFFFFDHFDAISGGGGRWDFRGGNVALIRDNPNRRLSHAGVAIGDFALDPRPSSRGRQAVRFGDGVALLDLGNGSRHSTGKCMNSFAFICNA